MLPIRAAPSHTLPYFPSFGQQVTTGGLIFLSLRRLWTGEGGGRGWEDGLIKKTNKKVRVCGHLPTPVDDELVGILD